MYEGSAARRMDAFEEAYAQPRSRASLRVYEGAGLDAQVRRGVSPQLIAALKVAAAAVLVLATFCFVRIGIYSASVSVLAENTAMRTQLKETRAERDELRIERSVLSSSSRIERIATQTYGMVLANGSETLTVGAAAAAAEAAAAEAAAAEAEAAKTAEAAASQAAAEEEAARAAEQEAKQQAAADAIESATVTQGDGSTAGANAVDVDSL